VWWGRVGYIGLFVHKIVDSTESYDARGHQRLLLTPLSPSNPRSLSVFSSHFPSGNRCVDYEWFRYDI
jgi:hypothetical protein